MAPNSSFLPRITLQRGDNPILPLHNQSGAVRKKPSEYDLSELSPRPENVYPRAFPSRNPSSSRRDSSPSVAQSDRASNAGSASKTRQRPMFDGPPPPITASRMIYRDEEDRDSYVSRNLDASSFARNINSVLFDRGSPARTRDAMQEYEPDTIWRNLQRRERSLQNELQLLLDAQSAGLAANLDPAGAPSSRSDVSDAGSSTPTTTLQTTDSPVRRSRVILEEPARVTQTGALIPVRQPRKKPLGLRGARAGLARNIALLADLKVEEDASLTAALSTRKKALAQLRKLSARRAGIAEELRALEAEEEEPLARELRELGEEHNGVTAEIAELEERLVGLRNRRRWLDGRIEDVRNRREAGLSGYKGALREVEGRVSALLSKPPIKPLDFEAIAAPRTQGSESGSHAGEPVEQSPDGAEFLRLRPERRTLEMARDWWESEVAILERRKEEVDRERLALEEGVEVWKAAARLVTDFEAELRQEMKTNFSDHGGGTNKTSLPSPEQAMHAQLEKMATVIQGLEDRLHLAEDKGWNLLICAIGAELAAFKEAEYLLREALRGAGLEVGEQDDQGTEGEETYYTAETATPRVGRSTSNLRSFADSHDPDSITIASRSFTLSRTDSRKSQADTNTNAGAKNKGELLDLHSEEDARAAESDNEVPADLLVGPNSPTLSREDSENEVPPEFLAQHNGEDGEVE
ncbi:hypothetical protein QBC34DRAFT_408932 [Podospora aff. communis PSN243]|uniref:Autophagy-related protein 28 n=1 Tax=Podospora aff. communis PSN243 TaxID=3040156 RepID=A0AAV9GK74_9PEZI|nr:hypothetical protein QBC34DRAFT_408932 [Podospora aff. communis PSN243]